MRARAAIRSPAAEVVGYVVLAIALGAFLWSRIGEVDGFYLDEWAYVHGGEYIWTHLPGSLWGTIPFWDRGAQRLYSTLMGPFWSTLSTSTAFTVLHVVNVALLVSAIAPAALIARRLLESPLLRLLAAALAVAVPWLTIGSHLLTENLAFPLYMWSVYAIVACAETPSLRRQVGALAAIAAVGLCRLNLAFLVLVLFVAVIVAEALRRRDERDLPRRQWLRGLMRREALIVAAAVVCVAIGVAIAIRGSGGVSGRYGILDFSGSVDRLFGAGAKDTWRTVLTYFRGILVGGFVFPFAIGTGVAFAGIAGRLGRRFVIPSLVAVLGALVVVVVVSTSTVGGSIEERYVMYVYPPLAILAVAGIPVMERVRLWLIPGAALAVYVLAEGIPPPFFNAGNFFAAPGGAFWGRVVEHRLVSAEDDLLGWLVQPKGWILVALGLAAMCVFVLVAGRAGRASLVVPVLAGGLALCAVGQVLVLGYDFDQELHGTAEAPGGIAGAPGHDADRHTWLDDRGSPDGGVAIMPGLIGDGGAWGGTEVEQFWNKSIDSTASLTWDGTVLPVPPGYSVAETRLGAGGVAEWLSRPTWLAAHSDDPRVQFAGSLVERSPTSRYALYRTGPSMKAVWTSSGLQPDGAVLRGAPVQMVLNRAAQAGVRAVTLTLDAVPEAKRPVRWRITRGGRTVTGGELRPKQDREVRLALPACPATGRCGPVRWELAASGPAVPTALPDYGAAGEPRPVVLHLSAAHVDVSRP